MDNEARLCRCLEMAREGDDRATAEIGRVVELIAQQMARGRAGALAGGIEWEDVAQEALLRLLGSSSFYRGTGSVRGYIHATVKTSLLQTLRSRRRREKREASYSAESFPPTAAPSSEGMAGGRVDLETRRLAEEILTALDPECRELVQRIFLHGASYARLAQERGHAESSVRARLSRCLRRARERFQ